MKKKSDINSGLNFRLANETNTGINSIASKVVNLTSRIMIVLLLCVGSVFTFTTMMNVKMKDWIIYAVAIVASVIFTVIYRYSKRKWPVFVVSLAAVILAGLCLFNFSQKGVTAIYDCTVKSIYDAMYWTAPDPILKWHESYAANTTYCISLLTVLVSSAAAYFSVARTQFIGAFLVTFPLFEIGAAFGCVPNHFAFAVLVGGWGAMLTLHISNRQRNVIKNKSGTSKKIQKQFAYKNKTEKFGGSAVAVSVSVILVFSIISNILTSNGFSRSDKLNQFRENFKETVLNSVDLITGIDHDASLKDGRLYELGDRKVKNRHYATLEIPDIDQEIYLKGYVGSVYTGSSWETFSDDKFKEIDSVKSYLNSVGVTLPTATGDVLDSYNGGQKLKYGEFKLFDLRRDKDYMYIQSGAVSNVEFKPYQDYKTVTEKDEYSYTAYYEPYSFVNIPYCVVNGSSEYITQWKNYVSFVEQNYTLLPEGIDDVARLGQQFRGNDVYEIVDMVRAFLSENTQYSDMVQKLPNGKEFVSYFIFEKGVGYSPHYATAAAVMLRALGIPTRYVEGYYISEAQVNEAKAVNGKKTVELTDGNQHAWIEIFDADYGWIPVEVTNGHYDESFSKMMQQNQDAAQNNKNNKDSSKKDDTQGSSEKKEDEANNNNQQDGGDDAENKVESPDETVEVATDTFIKQDIFTYLLIILATLVLIIIVTALVFIIRRAKIIKKRTKIFNSTDYRRQVILGFELLIGILKFKGVDIDNAYSYEQLRETIKENCPEDINVDLDRLFEIYEKALFSKLLITEEYASLVLDFVDDFGYDLYINSTLGVRLKIKYVKVLL